MSPNGADRPSMPETLFEELIAVVEGADPDAALLDLISRHPAHADAIRKYVDSGLTQASISDGFLKGRAGMTSIGSQVGPYRILERLGSGGMGEVYKAERREPVRQLVALKVVKQGLATKEVLARFALERRALAAMNHRSIAKVLDAGATESGEP